MIGMNVTLRCQLREEDVQALCDAPWPQTRFLSRLIAVWQRHRPHWHPAMPYMHDPLTITALCRPEFFRFKTMTVRLFTTGYMVPFVPGGSLVRAATSLQEEQARSWGMQRLLQPAL
jgi:inosine-uridine nucleoside N-ribohydrolase